MYIIIEIIAIAMIWFVVNYKRNIIYGVFDREFYIQIIILSLSLMLLAKSYQYSI